MIGDWWQLVVVGGWRLVVAGSWRQLLAVGGWRVVAVGGWWELAVGGWWSLGTVLKGSPWQKKKSGSLRTVLCSNVQQCVRCFARAHGWTRVPKNVPSPPPPLSFPTPGKTAPHHPLGDRTDTVHAHLQAQKLQHKTKEFSIGMHHMSNDLRQNRFPRGADEHHTCPRGKHGCAIKFHFSESEQNVLP